MIIVIADTYQQAKHFAESANLTSKQFIYVGREEDLKGRNWTTNVVAFGSLQSLEARKAHTYASRFFDIVMRVRDIG